MKPLRLETLHLIQDGALALVVDQKLSEIFADCVERPQLEKDRTLTVKITVKPSGDDPLQAASVAFQVSSSMPGSAVRQHMKYLRKNRTLAFEPDTAAIESLEGQGNLFEPEEGGAE